MPTDLLTRIGLRAAVRWCSGFWCYLAERARCKNAVELEHAWNRGTATALARLTPGGVLHETSPQGRSRTLWSPSAADRPNALAVPRQWPVIGAVDSAEEGRR